MGWHDFVSLTCHIAFKDLPKLFFFLFDFPKARQSVLNRNVRLFTFNFISTTLHDVWDENRYQHITS